MILVHCPLVVDDTRLILGVDSVVAIKNLPHFGVLTHKSWLPGQQYSHHLQRGLGRCSVPLAGICMEYVPSYLPRVTPPQLDTLWFLVPGSRKTAKHPQLLTRAKQRWQLAGSLRDISTHSCVGFNVFTALQHDVVWVQMFIMKASGYPVYRSRSPHLLTERYWLHQFCINFTHSRQLAAAGAYIAAFSIHFVIYVHWALWPPTGSHNPAKYGECDI